MPEPVATPPMTVPAPKAATAAPSVAEASLPAPTPRSPVAATPTSPVSDPGGDVAVKATKAGATRVGAAACKLCHRVQFESWAQTAHGKRTPPLDCESCHGPGSDYKSMPVMKDAAQAQAAGLVIPGAAFCATCHKHGWKDDQLKKAHAHKARTPFCPAARG